MGAPGSPLEMCGVQCVVCKAGRSVECLAGHHISCLSSVGHLDVKMFVVRAGWCPQLTNEHELLFIRKCSCVYLIVKKTPLNPAYMGLIQKI